MEKEIECEAERGEQKDQSHDEQQSAVPIGAFQFPETARLSPSHGPVPRWEPYAVAGCESPGDEEHEKESKGRTRLRGGIQDHRFIGGEVER